MNFLIKKISCIGQSDLKKIILIITISLYVLKKKYVFPISVGHLTILG